MLKISSVILPIASPRIISFLLFQINQQNAIQSNALQSINPDQCILDLEKWSNRFTSTTTSEPVQKQMVNQAFGTTAHFRNKWSKSSSCWKQKTQTRSYGSWMMFRAWSCSLVESLFWRRHQQNVLNLYGTLVFHMNF